MRLSELIVNDQTPAALNALAAAKPTTALLFRLLRLTEQMRPIIAAWAAARDRLLKQHGELGAGGMYKFPDVEARAAYDMGMAELMAEEVATPPDAIQLSLSALGNHVVSVADVHALPKIIEVVE